MNKTLEEKKVALINYLKTKPIDEWVTDEEIIACLPDYFKAKPATGGTTLDRSIHTVMKMTHADMQDLIINNGKKQYKLATKSEAIEYKRHKYFKGLKYLMEAREIAKGIQAESNLDLLTNKYLEIFRGTINE